MKSSLLLTCLGLAIAGCGDKPQATTSKFPEYTVLEGNCPERSNNLSGTCKIIFKEQFANSRSIQFAGSLNKVFSRITFVLNASTPQLTDGVHLTFYRTQNNETNASIRVQGRDFSVLPAKSQFWVPASLALTFDFHPRANQTPHLMIWRNGFSQSAITADMNSDYPNTFSENLTGIPNAGGYNGVLLQDATLSGDYVVGPTKAPTTP